MNLLDDDIDDLLHAFRADEARLDDSTRARMWAVICAEEPDAHTALDALDPHRAVRQLRTRIGARPRARMLAVAATVLVLLALGGLAIRSGPDDGAVTAGPDTTAPLPATLQELADQVAVLPTAVLGSSPDARYTYQASTVTDVGPTTDATARTETRWIGLDGSGRLVIPGPSGRNDTKGPGSYPIGQFTPEGVVQLSDDIVALATAIGQTADGGTLDANSSPGLVEALTYAGVPGSARAGLIRGLDSLGFRPVSAPELGPNLWRVEGPGPDGSTMQADLDLLTGEVVASTRVLTDGQRIEKTITEVDLRGDTRGP